MIADAYAIFERARTVWSAQRYPAVVAYTVDVNADPAAGSAGHRHYHEYWYAADGRVVVKPPVSDEQLAHPYKPPAGVNVMNVWNVGGPRQGTGVKDFAGVPMLAPNYTFGIAVVKPASELTSADIVQQIRDEYHDPAPQKVNDLQREQGLKTIAVVTSADRVYRVTLAGVEPGENGSDYHLQLTPTRDPSKYRLRDVWIDTQTYLTRKARIAGNFTDAAMEGVSWLVRFEQTGAATYIANETAEKPITGFHGLMYSAYTVTFEGIRAAQPPPFAIFGSSHLLLEP